jgi:hypothetical protein
MHPAHRVVVVGLRSAEVVDRVIQIDEASQAEAKITRTDGVKTYVSGHLADEDGVTVEAEGIFIQPRWARG